MIDAYALATRGALQSFYVGTVHSNVSHESDSGIFKNYQVPIFVRRNLVDNSR